MKWPFVFRSTYDALQAEKAREEKLLNRRLRITQHVSDNWKEDAEAAAGRINRLEEGIEAARLMVVDEDQSTGYLGGPSWSLAVHLAGLL